MEDEKLLKHLFYEELAPGKHPRHTLLERFKDIVNSNLKNLEISVKDWPKWTENRSGLRKLVFEGCNHFEIKKVEHF